MVSTVIPVPSFDLVIFGASGDLALRKLFPALAQRNREGVLPDDSRILAVVRKDEDVAGLPKEIAAKLEEEAGINGILVGDSLGNVMLGLPDTISVTMEDMITFGHAVASICRIGNLLIPNMLPGPIPVATGFGGKHEAGDFLQTRRAR